MVYCTKCGNKNDDDAEFCNKCGAALDNENKEHYRYIHYMYMNYLLQPLFKKKALSLIDYEEEEEMRMAKIKSRHDK